MIFKLIETAPSPSGEEVVCKLTATDGRLVQRFSGSVAADFFGELGIPSETTEEKEIDGEKFDEIVFYMKKTDAIKTGLKLLEYSQNTRRALCAKLAVRGFSREIASAAADYLEGHGYINEYDMACALVDDLANRRLYGAMRIKNELFAKGFAQDVSARAMEDADVDYVSMCAERIKKAGGTDIFKDKISRVKAISSLARYGFTLDEIKEAIKLVDSEK
ncbi:MAG: regulatory protein RecX [Clostridia bacterium]|nr:regulatory protein RecX [Clostridia bacterium]